MLGELLVAVGNDESYPHCNSHCESEEWSMTADEDDEVIARARLTETPPDHLCAYVSAYFKSI